jgi:aminoglycoside phosphotransferase (APT) family kinase protein
MLDLSSGQAIATAYALGQVVEFLGPVDRGALGEIWRLTSATGIWAVKVTFADLTEETAEVSARLQTLARSRGVPAPAVRLTPAGRCWTRIGDTMVRVYGWVDLLGLNRDLDPVLVGQTLAALHRTVLPTSDPSRWWDTEPVGAAGWDEMLTEARHQQAPFADRLAELRNELVALESLLQPVDPVQICHLDLWADNVRATPDGGLCIFDWDNAGPGDPARELALVLFEFGHGRPDRFAALYAAYRAAGGPGRIRTEADFTMLIAQLHHICELDLRRWLGPGPDDVERASALAHLYEFLDDPFDRDVLTEILSVTRSLDSASS